jgi:hypothetical protein
VKKGVYFPQILWYIPPAAHLRAEIFRANEGLADFGETLRFKGQMCSYSPSCVVAVFEAEGSYARLNVLRIFSLAVVEYSFT